VTSEVTIDQWTAAARAIDSAERILLVAHVTPDADALGSALALGLALSDQGKQIQVSVGEEGFTVPTSLGFLPGVHLVVSPEDVVSPDLKEQLRALFVAC
jgi:phosphoesterase RecJ-like protein